MDEERLVQGGLLSWLLHDGNLHPLRLGPLQIVVLEVLPHNGHHAVLHQTVMLEGLVVRLQLLQRCLQATPAHHEGHALLPLGVLREATHEEHLHLTSLQGDRAHVLGAALHPVGYVSPRLRHARGVQSEDPHHWLDGRHELLLEVRELVQSLLGRADAHVVLRGFPARLAQGRQRLCSTFDSLLPLAFALALRLPLCRSLDSPGLAQAALADGAVWIQPLVGRGLDEVHILLADVPSGDAWRWAVPGAEPGFLAVVAVRASERREVIVHLLSPSEDALPPLSGLPRVAVEHALALGQSPLVPTRKAWQKRLPQRSSFLLLARLRLPLDSFPPLALPQTLFGIHLPLGEVLGEARKGVEDRDGVGRESLVLVRNGPVSLANRQEVLLGEGASLLALLVSSLAGQALHPCGLLPRKHCVHKDLRLAHLFGLKIINIHGLAGIIDKYFFKFDIPESFKKIPSGIIPITEYAGGGMVGIRKPHAIPPERQGLRSIMINGKKS